MHPEAKLALSKIPVEDSLVFFLEPSRESMESFVEKSSLGDGSQSVRAESFISEQGAEVSSRMFAEGRCYIKCCSPFGHDFCVRVTENNEMRYKNTTIKEIFVTKTEGDKKYVMGEREIVSYEMFAAVYGRAREETGGEVMLVCSGGFCVLEDGMNHSYTHDGSECKISICPIPVPVVDMCEYMKDPRAAHEMVARIHECLFKEKMTMIKMEDDRMCKAIMCLKGEFSEYMDKCYRALHSIHNDIRHLKGELSRLRDMKCEALCSSDRERLKCDIRDCFRRLKEKMACKREILCEKIPRALALRHDVDHIISELRGCRSSSGGNPGHYSSSGGY